MNSMCVSPEKKSLRSIAGTKRLENTAYPKYLGVTLDRALSYKQHTQMKVAIGNNLLTKLANPSTIRTLALALSYSTAEYSPQESGPITKPSMPISHSPWTTWRCLNRLHTWYIAAKNNGRTGNSTQETPHVLVEKRKKPRPTCYSAPNLHHIHALWMTSLRSMM